MKLLKKKILITGANSLVGTGICRVLFERGYDLYGTYNTNKKNFNNKICKLYKINFLNKNFEKKISDIIKYNKIKYIIHNASLIPAKIKNKKKINDFNQINFNSTLAITKILNRFSISKLILISTLAVLNKKKILNKIEEKYVNSKKKSEKLCVQLRGKTKVLILRIKAPYGFDLKSNSVVHKFIRLSKKGSNLELINKGERTQSFTFVDDIGRAVFNILKNKKISKVNNLNGSKVITMNSLANKILKRFKKKKKQKIVYKKAHEDLQKILPVKQNEFKLSKRTSIDEGLKLIFKTITG